MLYNFVLLPIKFNRNDEKRRSRAVRHFIYRMKIFDEPIFAWDLLEWEMAIEMNESVSGKAIAKLLELYMVRDFLFRKE